MYFCRGVPLFHVGYASKRSSLLNHYYYYNMKKGFLSLAMLFLIAITSFAEGRAKYVFYFIGDGMGVNQVNGTETYLAALQGRIGVEPLLFTQFPAVGLVTTFLPPTA